MGKVSEYMKFYESVPKYRLLAVEKWAKSIKFDVLDVKYLKNAQNDSTNDKNDSKNDKNVNFIVFLENLDLDLHFDIGFGGIRQLEQFVCNFEICSWNHEFSSILLLWQK